MNHKTSRSPRSSRGRRDYIQSPSQNRIIRHVDYVNNIIQKDRISGSFINRPIVNLNRPELDLDHRAYLQWSPTRRKHFLTTSKFTKNNSDKSRSSYYKGRDRWNEMLKAGTSAHNHNNDVDSIEYFQRGMYSFL
jgi:hypothetical protein